MLGHSNSIGFLKFEDVFAKNIDEKIFFVLLSFILCIQRIQFKKKNFKSLLFSLHSLHALFRRYTTNTTITCNVHS